MSPACQQQPESGGNCPLKAPCTSGIVLVAVDVERTKSSTSLGLFHCVFLLLFMLSSATIEAIEVTPTDGETVANSLDSVPVGFTGVASFIIAWICLAILLLLCYSNRELLTVGVPMASFIEDSGAEDTSGSFYWIFLAINLSLCYSKGDRIYWLRSVLRLQHFHRTHHFEPLRCW